MNRTDVAGNYEYSDRISYYSNVLLKTDSTFEFRSEAGLSSSVSSGKWKLKGRKIILNSYHQKHENAYTMINVDTIVDELDSFRLKIIDIHGNDLPFSKVRLIDNETNKTAMLDFESNLTICKTDFDSIYIKSFYCPEIGIAKNEFKANKVTIQFDQGIRYYRYFLDEKWSIRPNRLYAIWLKKNKFQKQNYYKRVDSLVPIIAI